MCGSLDRSVGYACQCCGTCPCVVSLSRRKTSSPCRRTDVVMCVQHMTSWDIWCPPKRERIFTNPAMIFLKSCLPFGSITPFCWNLVALYNIMYTNSFIFAFWNEKGPNLRMRLRSVPGGVVRWVLDPGGGGGPTPSSWGRWGPGVPEAQGGLALTFHRSSRAVINVLNEYREEGAFQWDYKGLSGGMMRAVYLDKTEFNR